MPSTFLLSLTQMNCVLEKESSFTIRQTTSSYCIDVRDLHIIRKTLVQKASKTPADSRHLLYREATAENPEQNLRDHGNVSDTLYKCSHAIIDAQNIVKRS